MHITFVCKHSLTLAYLSCCHRSCVLQPSHLDFLAPWLRDGNDDKTCTTTQPCVSAGKTASTKHNNNSHQHSTNSPSHLTQRRQPPTNALTITRILPSPLLSSRALVAKPFSSVPPPSPSHSPSISPSSVSFISSSRSASFPTNALPQQANPAPSAPKRRTTVSISAMAAQHCPACCLFEPMVCQDLQSYM